MDQITFFRPTWFASLALVVVIATGCVPMSQGTAGPDDIRAEHCATQPDDATVKCQQSAGCSL